jgi:hypothetical protein
MAENPILITHVGQSSKPFNEKWRYLLVCNVKTEDGRSMVLQFTSEAADQLKKAIEDLPPPMRSSGLQKIPD